MTRDPVVCPINPNQRVFLSRHARRAEAHVINEQITVERAIRPGAQLQHHRPAGIGAQVNGAPLPGLAGCRAAQIDDVFGHVVDQDAPPVVPGKEKPDADGAPPIIVIPRVYWQWTGERVCVQEFIGGISGRRLQAVDQAGLDRKVLARRGANAVLKMIVEDGLFHADPHPGNVFYLPGNRIAFIDFGMVGRLAEERRDQLIRLLLGLVRNDAGGVADVMLEWTSDGVTNEQDLLLEVRSFIDRYHGVPLKQLRLSTMLSDLVAIPRQHHLVLPNDLSLLIKAFVTLEGFGRELDPGFDMANHALPLLERAMFARYSPAALLRRGRRAAGDIFSLLAGLPQDLSRLLRAARRGRLEVHIDVTHLRRVGDQLDRAVSRLAISIVTAALIVGSAIVMTVEREPSLPGLPSFGLLGFIAAVIGGIWVLVSIWRGGKG